MADNQDRRVSPSQPHTIRFPMELYWELQAGAKKSMRTFNSEVIYWIKKGREDDLHNCNDQNDASTPHNGE